MKPSRDIGEFKPLGFVAATVLFLVAGGTLYSRLGFHVEPRESDALTRQQAEIADLKARIERLEKAADNLQSDPATKKDYPAACHKESRHKRNPCPSTVR